MQDKFENASANGTADGSAKSRGKSVFGNIFASRRALLILAFIGLSLVIGTIASGMLSLNTVVYGEMVSIRATELDLSGMGGSGIEGLERCRRLQKLDLSGNDITVEDYRKLRDMLPACEIVWDIPVAGEKYPCSTGSLTVLPQSAEDFTALKYFGNLTSVDLSGCTMYSEIADFAAGFDGECLWTVNVGDTVISSTDTEADVTAESGSADRIAELLGYLPKLETVRISGSMTNEELDGLQQKLDGVEVIWYVRVGNLVMPRNVTGFTVGEGVDCEELADTLRYMNALETVDISAAGFTDEQKTALCEQYPDVAFDWNITLYGRTVSRLAEFVDLSGVKVKSTKELEEKLPLLVNVKTIDMVDCGLYNGVMSALCDKHPEIKFIWVINIFHWHIRTDATAFSTRQASNTQNRQSSYDMRFLKYCTDMEALDLGHNAITDLDFLTGMTKLRILILSDNKLTDISDLAKLPNLEYFEAFKNQITDITPLAQLENLVDLNLYRNKITDITPLLGLKKIERLWLGRNDDLTEEDFEKLRQTFPNAEYSFYNRLDSTGDGWRTHERYYEMAEMFKYENVK